MGSAAASVALAVTVIASPPSDPSFKFRAREIVKDFGVGYAVAAGDFGGDKRPDIVASGRATRNSKTYWNETPKKKTWADDSSFGVRGGSAA
jgi:hypothetical protein